MGLPIYLDYPATTPIDPRVAQKMIPYLTERTHSLGWEAKKAVEEGRAQVAQLVCAEPNEIVWTSGESNNLATKGVAHVGGDKGKHMVTVKTEHKAMVAATGIRILAHVDYEKQRHNLFVVAISIGVGMIPLVSDKLFAQLPTGLGTILHSGILLATIAAVGLNLYFNGMKSVEETRRELAATTHSAE